MTGECAFLCAKYTQETCAQRRVAPGVRLCGGWFMNYFLMHNCLFLDDADGVRDRLRLVQLEKPVHASSYGRCSFHLSAHTCGVGLKVLVESTSQLFRGSIVRSFVSPAFARTQDFRRHAGALNDDLETEYWITRRFRLRESTAVNSVNDRACIFEADPFAGAISPACPPGVNQADACLVLSHLFR